MQTSHTVKLTSHLLDFKKYGRVFIDWPHESPDSWYHLS